MVSKRAPVRGRPWRRSHADVALDTLLLQALNNEVADAQPIIHGKDGLKAHPVYQLRAQLIAQRRESLNCSASASQRASHHLRPAQRRYRAAGKRHSPMTALTGKTHPGRTWAGAVRNVYMWQKGDFFQVDRPRRATHIYKSAGIADRALLFEQHKGRPGMSGESRHFTRFQWPLPSVFTFTRACASHFMPSSYGCTRRKRAIEWPDHDRKGISMTEAQQVQVTRGARRQ